MNNEVETSPTTIGIFRVSRYKSEAGNKALAIFTKLKQKAGQIEASPGSEAGSVIPLKDIEPNLEELRDSAMNSYRLQDEVVKTESGFEVV